MYPGFGPRIPDLHVKTCLRFQSESELQATDDRVIEMMTLGNEIKQLCESR